jgi:hypothetical protein
MVRASFTLPHLFDVTNSLVPWSGAVYFGVMLLSNLSNIAMLVVSEFNQHYILALFSDPDIYLSSAPYVSPSLAWASPPRSALTGCVYLAVHQGHCYDIYEYVSLSHTLSYWSGLLKILFRTQHILGHDHPFNVQHTRPSSRAHVRNAQHSCYSRYPLCIIST